MNKEDLIRFIMQHQPDSSIAYLEKLSLENLVIIKVSIELELEKRIQGELPLNYSQRQ